MRRIIATTIIVLASVLAPAASASSTLTIPRARTAIAHTERVTVHRCHRNGPLKVRCQVSELITEGAYAGWTFAFTAEATLRQTGDVEVTTPDL